MSSATRGRLVVIVGVLAALLVAVSWWRIDHPTDAASGTPTPRPTPSATPPEKTAVSLLLQLRDDEQLAVGNEQFVVNADGKAQGIMAPSPLQVYVAGVGQMTLAQTGKLPNINNAAIAISDLIGIRVDQTLVLDRLGYEALVDSVGGVLVSVDAPIVKKMTDGSTVIVVAAGTRHLDGPAATAYAMSAGVGEGPTEQQNHFATVNKEVLAKLPSDPQKLKGILGSLGVSFRSSTTPDDVASALLRLQVATQGGLLVQRTMPVTTVDSTSPLEFRVDFIPMNALVNTSMSEVALKVPPQSNVRVLMFDGIRNKTFVAAAATQLTDASLRYLDAGPAIGIPVSTTQVIVASTDAQSLEWGRAVVKALGLPASTPITSVPASASKSPSAAGGGGLVDESLVGVPDPRLIHVAQVTVVLGADYRGPGTSPTPSAPS